MNTLLNISSADYVRIAKATELHRTTVSRVLTDPEYNPTEDTLRRISNALGVTYTRLVEHRQGLAMLDEDIK